MSKGGSQVKLLQQLRLQEASHAHEIEGEWDLWGQWRDIISELIKITY